MCDEYARKYLENKVGDGEIASFYAELYNSTNNFFCPDFETAKIQGDASNSTSFNILVELAPSYQQGLQDGSISKANIIAELKKTRLAMRYLTQFFTPENWKSLGYNLFITRKEVLLQASHNQ